MLLSPSIKFMKSQRIRQMSKVSSPSISVFISVVLIKLTHFSCFPKDKKLRSKIYKWLSPPDPFENHDFNLRARGEQDTGKWFLESPEFIAWMDEDISAPLWLHGIRTSAVFLVLLHEYNFDNTIAGNGKSVLWYTLILSLHDVY